VWACVSGDGLPSLQTIGARLDFSLRGGRHSPADREESCRGHPFGHLSTQPERHHRGLSLGERSRYFNPRHSVGKRFSISRRRKPTLGEIFLHSARPYGGTIGVYRERLNRPSPARFSASRVRHSLRPFARLSRLRDRICIPPDRACVL